MQSRVILNAKENTGEVFVYDAIGEWFGGVSAKSIAEDLKRLKDVKHVDVRINSPGGEVFDGLAIYNQLIRFKGKIHTHIDGMAFSIASVIALAGDEVHIADNASMMIHDPWDPYGGNAAEKRKQADVLDRIADQIVTVYAGRTKAKDAEIRELMAAETFLNADEATKLGFATSVVESKRVAAAAFDPKLMPYMNSPRARDWVDAHGTVAQWEKTAVARKRLQDQLTYLKCK